MPSDPAFEGGDRFYLPRTAQQFRAATGDTGVAGDPTFSTPETGKAAFDAMVDGLTKVLQSLSEARIPEPSAGGIRW